MCYLGAVAYAGKKFGGVQGRGSALVGGPGGGAPRTPENFRKFAKNSRRKLKKILYFRLFCKEITKSRVKYSRVWTKNTIGWGNFQRILKLFDNFQKIPEENCKNCWIYAYFAKKLQNHALNFRSFGRKTQLVGEILRKFWKFSKICNKFLQKNAKTAVFTPILQRN